MTLTTSRRTPTSEGGQTPAGRWILSAWESVVTSHYLSALGGLTLLVYLLLWPGNRTESEDGFAYAAAVESGDASPTSRHVLYGPLMRAVHLAVGTVDPSVRAYSVMCTVSVVAAVGAACLTAWLIRRVLHQPALIALAGGGMLAFSYGFWRYATEAEMYALASLAAVGASALVLARGRRLNGAVTAGLVGGLAILLHSANVVVVAAAMATYLVGRRTLGLLVAYGASAGASATIGLLITVWLSDRSLVPSLGESSTMVDLLTPVRGAVGLGQAVVSGNFLFTYPGFRDILGQVFPFRSFVEEAYAGDRASVLVGVLGPATAVLVVVATLFTVWAAWRGRSGGAAPHPPKAAAVMISIWFAGMAVAALLTSSGNPEGWLFSLPPLVLAVAGWVLPHSWRAAPVAVVALPLLLLVHNIVGGMAVIKSEDGDYNRARASWMLAELSDEDTLLTAASPVSVRYFRYHSGATIHALYAVSGSEVASLRQSDDDGRLFITGDVIDPPEWLRVSHPDVIAETSPLVADISSELTLVHRDDTQVVYEYDG